MPPLTEKASGHAGRRPRQSTVRLAGMFSCGSVPASFPWLKRSAEYLHEILIDVKEVSGKAVPAVTSLQVAEVFEKRHDNVLRDIEHILSQLPENFIKLNFEEYAAEYRAGFGMRKTPVYPARRKASPFRAGI